MRYANLLLAAVAGLALISCKRTNEPRPAPDDGRASATQPAPPESSPATQPSTQPATQAADATITEPQLLQFINASRKFLDFGHSETVVIEATPDGFAVLADVVNSDDAFKALIIRSGMSPIDWKAVGTRAWTAWSIAQGDYNSEAPLRENEKQLAAARARLASAEAMVKGGVRVLSAEERAKRVAASHDAAVNATDRAEMWAQEATKLRDQLAESSGGVGDAIPGQSAAVSTARAEAQADIRAAQASTRLALAAAEQDERRAREEAKSFEAAAQHPEQTSDGKEKSDLLRAAQEEIGNAKADIQRFQEATPLIQARLEEDRRVDAANRRKASESDVKLLREHLAAFNDAWGMTVEGRRK